MRRRDFIAGIAGSATVWPRAARAQQPAMPVIGFLGAGSPGTDEARVRAFRQSLGETGYAEGRTVTIEYRWAVGHNDRFPALAHELVRRQVAVIVAAGGTPSALAAKAATATIPVVFGVAVDPVETGLVASLNRPGGNVTGVTNLNAEVGPKRLELLREVIPTATIIGVLVNPSNSALSATFMRVLQAAAQALGQKLHILQASTDRDLDEVFTTLAQLRAGALIIGPDPFLNTRAEQIAALTVRHAIPTIFQYRRFAAAGGLMSYGSDETDYYRLLGTYAGRILKGEKPADLPVQQATKVEFILNLKTAKALGLTIPFPLLGRADEVIE